MFQSYTNEADSVLGT